MKRIFVLLIFIFLSIPACFAKENINVAVNIDDHYTTYALLTFNSILKNNKSNSDYTFYILHDKLSPINKLRIKWFVKKHKQKVEFIYVDIEKRIGLKQNIFKESNAEHVNNIGIARIFLPVLLPESVKKCLYLDSDTLVVTDLKELWDTNISQYAAGMCRDSHSDDIVKMYPEIDTYYNSGVILMNLDYMRRICATEEMLKHLKYNMLHFPDQDVLNIVLDKHVKKLDSQWDYMYMSASNYATLPKANKAIIHYICKIKPWNFLDKESQPELIKLYYSYWKNSDLKFSYALNFCKIAFKTDILLNYYKNNCSLFCNKMSDKLDKLKYAYYYSHKKANVNITPKVSVIIPVYNGESYINSAISYLQKQTFKDFEVILVDDGSNDKTPKLLEEKTLSYKNFRVIHHQKNQGAGAARNTGLDAAKGDYVIFLDIDDEYDKNLLKKMYKKAIKTDSDIVVSNIYSDLKNLCNLTNKDIFNYKDIPELIFWGTRSCVWDKMYKREFLLENNLKFNQLKHGEDVYFTNRSIILADKITTIPDRVITYVDSKNSVTKQINNHPNDSIEAWLLTKKFLEKNGIYKDVEQSYLTAIIDSFLWTYNRLDDKNKKRLVKKYKPEFKELGIFDKDFKYYYHIYEYIQLKHIMDMY